MSVYDAPADDGSPMDVDYDSPWLGYVRIILIVIGVLYVLMGLGFGGLYTAIPLLAASEDPDMLVMAPIGIFMGLCIGGFGLANVVCAQGLKSRSKWAFWVSLALGGMYLGSACMPFGAAIFYGLLGDEPTRKLFLS